MVTINIGNKSGNFSWASVAATLAAAAGVVGTVLVPLDLGNLTTGVQDILQGLSALLVLVPTHHVAATARANAVAKAAASIPAPHSVPPK